MDKLNRDDLIHALTQTYGFYDKEFDSQKFKFWITACDDLPLAKVKSALMEHVRRSKFAPKPADIIAICQERGMRQAENIIDKALPKPEDRQPTELDRAWPYCIKLFCQGAEGIVGKSHGSGLKRLDTDVEERYLHLVNHHAKEQNMPEAIPDDFKIREVWG